MIESFLRTSGEVFQRHRRQFAHTILAGLAMMQFGCAHVQHVENDYHMPPEMKQSVLAGMKNIAKDVPVSFIKSEDYHQVMIDSWNEIQKYKDKGAINLDEMVGVRDVFVSGMIGKSRDLLNNPKGRVAFEERIKNLPLLRLYNIVRYYQHDVRPAVHPFDNDLGPVRLLVMPVDGELTVDNLLKPTEYDRKYLDDPLLREGLQEVLGEEVLQELRVEDIYHELGHASDLTDYTVSRNLPDEQKELAEETNMVKAETLADVGALNEMKSIGNDVERCKRTMYFRAIVCLLSTDVDHATQYTLHRIAKSKDPSVPEVPYLTTEEIHKGLTALWGPKEEITPDELPHYYNSTPPLLMTREEKKAFVAKAKALNRMMAGTFESAEQKRKFETPEVQGLVAFYRIAQTYFDDVMAKGKNAPDRRNGITTPVCRADAALK